MTRRLSIAAAFLFAAGSAHAKDGFGFGAGVEATYDSNVFRLAEDKLDRPGTDDGQPDKKYYEMESADDTILGVWGRVDFERGDTVLRLEPGGSLYRLNPKRTHARVDARVTRRLWKRGDLFADASLVPSRFKKNYLVDADPDGSSKVYDAGISTELGARLGLRSRITKSIDGDAWLGGGMETFAKPFSNRDRAVAEGGLGGDLKLGSRIFAGLAYRGSLVSTDDGDEVIVDADVRRVSPVDRSNVSHAVAPSIRVKLTSEARVRLGYELLSRAYTTDGADDPYRDRTDLRHTASGDVRIEITKRLRLEIGALLARAITDRPNDADAESDEVDYQRFVAWLALNASF